MAQGSDSSALDEPRLRELIDVGRSLVAELDPEVIFQQVLEVACELTGARYAALGVLDEDRHELERFITRGIDAETRRRDRQPAARARGARPADRAAAPAAPRRGRPPPPLLRLPARPSADDELPRRAGDDPRPRLGQPLPDREERRRLRPGRRAGGDDPRRVDGDRGRERAPVPQRAAARDEMERAVHRLEATTEIARAVGGETDLDRILEIVVKRGRALVEARSLLILLARATSSSPPRLPASTRAASANCAFRSPARCRARCSRRGRRVASAISTPA